MVRCDYRKTDPPISIGGLLGEYHGTRELEGSGHSKS